jgi:release factor glutamine methyltransferase
LILADVLRESIERLKSAGLENPVVDAEVLMAYVLKTERFKLTINNKEELSPLDIKKIRSAVNRRMQYEPVAYITGVKEFYSLEFKVNPGVLIPRPETELLVDLAIYYAPQQGVVLDIGTGSGIIAVSLKYCRRDLTVFATDISKDAISVARKNAKAILGRDLPRFCQGDIFTPVQGMTFDLIVSNPPYVDPGMRNALQKDLAYEPEIALFSEDSGRAAITGIIHNSRPFLSAGGKLLLEIGSEMKDFVIKEGRKKGFAVSVLNDYGGMPRVAVLQ